MSIRNGLDGEDAEKFVGFQEIENQPRLFCFLFGQCKKEKNINCSLLPLANSSTAFRAGITNQRKDPFFGRNFCYTKHFRNHKLKRKKGVHQDKTSNSACSMTCYTVTPCLSHFLSMNGKFLLNSFEQFAG